VSVSVRRGGTARAAVKRPRGRRAVRLGPERAPLALVGAVALGIVLLAQMLGVSRGTIMALSALTLLACGAMSVRRRVLPWQWAMGDREGAIAALGTLTPADFERHVAARFRQRGYRVEHVGGRGDDGVDVRVWRAGRRGIVQCKRYGTAHPIGPGVIRELVGTRALQRADMAWLATTGRVTPAARRLAAAEHIGVLDADAVIARASRRLSWLRPGTGW